MLGDAPEAAVNVIKDLRSVFGEATNRTDPLNRDAWWLKDQVAGQSNNQAPGTRDQEPPIDQAEPRDQDAGAPNQANSSAQATAPSNDLADHQGPQGPPDDQVPGPSNQVDDTAARMSMLYSLANEHVKFDKNEKERRDWKKIAADFSASFNITPALSPSQMRSKWRIFFGDRRRSRMPGLASGKPTRDYSRAISPALKKSQTAKYIGVFDVSGKCQPDLREFRTFLPITLDEFCAMAPRILHRF
eukprot:sb/3468931/